MVIETPPRFPPVARWSAGLVLTLAPPLIVYLTYLAIADRLPDPMPTHWDRHGAVDGTTGLAPFTAGVLAAAAVCGLLGLAAAVGARLPWQLRRGLLIAGAGSGGFVTGLWLAIATLALDHADPTGVPAPSWHIPVLLLGAGLWALLAFLVCGRGPAARPAAGRPGRDLPRMTLRPGERVVWSEVAYPSLVAYLLVGGLLVAAVGLAAWADPWVASPLLLSAGLTSLLSITRLVADRQGLRVGFGPWGWPRVAVPLDEIESAEATVARPSEWGGWGYRARPGGRAVVTRSGPAVRLQLSGSRVFVASTRDPDTVAALVNSLLDQTTR